MEHRLNYEPMREGVFQHRELALIARVCRLTTENRRYPRGWPAWLREAWRRPASQPGSLVPVNHPHSDGTDPLQITTVTEPIPVDFGDYLVENGPRLLVYKHHEFSLLYRNVAATRYRKMVLARLRSQDEARRTPVTPGLPVAIDEPRGASHEHEQ